MINYLKSINQDLTKAYVSYILANYSMPTLIHVKPSNVINVNKKYIEDTKKFFKLLKSGIEEFDGKFFILYENEESYLIMVYNKQLLNAVLQKAENNVLLDGFGYHFKERALEKVLLLLKKRYQGYKENGHEFPHEMGIMLGYPKEDVAAYIKNQGRNYKFCGIWKVYNDVDNAVKVFDYYHTVKRDAISIITSGKELNEIKMYYK